MDYILEVENVTKQIENFKLENINFKLEPGYVMGLIGPNGAGKTTLLMTILGLYHPTEGQVKICGYDMTEQEKAAKSQMGFVLDDNPFMESLSSKENARLYGRYYPEWSMKTFERYARDFELDIRKPMKKLSKGNKMKFQLAFALSHNAKLLVLDEPTAGLDPVFRRELLEIMCEIVSDGERSILYSTHLTNELDRLADYITFLQNGRQLFSLTKEELLERYRLVRGTEKQINALDCGIVVGKKSTESCTEALVRGDLISLPPELAVDRPNIEDIMFYTVQSL